MQNYYYDLSRLPETYDKLKVKAFLATHKITACEQGDAPKTKHIGSGAWHDDVLAFLIENYHEDQEVSEIPAKDEVEPKKKSKKSKNSPNPPEANG